MTKKVPQRRNKRAGKTDPKSNSRSTKYLNSGTPGSIEAKRKKKIYDAEFSSSKDQKDKRVATTKLSRKKPLKDKDYGHKKDGSIKPEKRHGKKGNRARNGKNGKSTKK